MFIYALTIFISAFLLFQIQPIIAKYILPWFGGTPAVWSTCMLFFQVLLLAGYAYAHWLASRTSTEKRRVLHPAIIGISFLVLGIAAMRWAAPIFPGADWMKTESEMPITNIILLLSISVGLPFFVLSTTGPLMQKWFSLQFPEKSPYWLYSLSNLGSLLGLLIYPFLIERIFRLKVQAWMWSLLFVLYGVLCASLARRKVCDVKDAGFLLNTNMQEASAENSLLQEGESIAASVVVSSPVAPTRPRLVDRFFWVLLPAGASLMLLAVTNQMCQEVAVFPFLWIVPLSIYLITFILCFGHERWYPGWFVALFFPAAFTMAMFAVASPDLTLRWQVLVYSSCLFLICMGCHGELVRLKPNPRYLTSFYLCISIGGALGGIFVAIIAPLVFTSFYEIYVGIAFCFLSIISAVFFSIKSLSLRKNSLGPALLLCMSLLIIGIVVVDNWTTIYAVLKSRFSRDNPLETIKSIKWSWAYGVGFSGLGLALLCWVLWPMWRRVSKFVAPVLYLASVILGYIASDKLYHIYKEEQPAKKWLYSSRNFFGVLHISSKTTTNRSFLWQNFGEVGEENIDNEGPPVMQYTRWYKLIHGSIIHGMQAADPEKRKIPCTYYSYKSGVGRILLNHPKLSAEGDNHLRVGAIGLGTGTLAAYIKEGDYICFYDINPKVPDIAWGEGGFFHYLQDCKDRGGKIDIVLGDGRLSMERQLKKEGSRQYDVIVLDAFSSDAIPVHLLTKEAFEIYLKHITKQGVLAVHISNRYLDLAPVVWKAAEQFGLDAILVSSSGNDDEGIYSSSWVLLTYDKDILKINEIADGAEEMPKDLSKYSLWTDDYSNLFRYLKK